MDKKQLKKERIKNYFIDAACDIIEESGISEASVRKVSEKAGYHYTTVYMHFGDFNQVLHMAIIKFLTRIKEFIAESTRGIEDPLDCYLSAWEAYCRYLMNHPNIAYCVIIQKNLDISAELREEIQNNPLSDQQLQALKRCVEAGYIPEKSAKDVFNMISFTCTGAVTHYLSGRRGLGIDEVLHLTDKAVRAIIHSANVSI